MKEEDFSFPAGILWKCQRCAKCCGDTSDRKRRIFLLPSEAKEIRKEEGFSLSLDKFCKRTGLKPFTLEMRKDSRGKCIFLKEKECQIYSVRPLVCRFYPFWLEKRDDGNFSFKFTNECVGIGSGETLNKDFFKSLFDIATNRINGKRDGRNFKM